MSPTLNDMLAIIAEEIAKYHAINDEGLAPADLLKEARENILRDRANPQTDALVNALVNVGGVIWEKGFEDGRQHVLDGNRRADDKPIPLTDLICPNCKQVHYDEPREGWGNPPHREHECVGCGRKWTPCLLNTTGVDAL